MNTTNAPILILEDCKKPKPKWVPPQADALPDPIVFSEWFGNSNPVELELGCGKGKFLLARSAAHPEINFMGIDWSQKWLSVGASKSAPNQSIKWIWGNVANLLKKIQPQSLSIVHIYFSDPWPKRRHRERRLVQKELLDELHGLLIPGGRIEIATDFTEYFECMKKAVGKSQASWKRLRISVNERLFDPEIKTHYEIKYEAVGKELYYLELIK